MNPTTAVRLENSSNQEKDAWNTIPMYLVTPTTKQCPFCGTSRLALFSSRNRKMCTVCNIDIVWELGKGQKPLIQAQR
jgi:uncharacterized protein (DUF983 family)